LFKDPSLREDYNIGHHKKTINSYSLERGNKMNIIDIIKELALIDEMAFSVPEFMRIEELIIGCTDIYGNCIAVYEDENCNKVHLIFSRDHRCIAHYVVNNETKIVVVNEDTTFGANWTTMTGLVCDISNLMEKEGFVFLNRPTFVIPMDTDVEAELKEIIKYSVENCTNVVHLDEIDE
jgi:hypothetical protein